jgi:hypothetical protein
VNGLTGKRVVILSIWDQDVDMVDMVVAKGAPIARIGRLQLNHWEAKPILRGWGAFDFRAVSKIITVLAVIYTGHQFIFSLGNEIDNGSTSRKDVIFIPFSRVLSPSQAWFMFLNFTL